MYGQEKSNEDEDGEEKSSLPAAASPPFPVSPQAGVSESVPCQRPSRVSVCRAVTGRQEKNGTAPAPVTSRALPPIFSLPLSAVCCLTAVLLPLSLTLHKKGCFRRRESQGFLSCQSTPSTSPILTSMFSRTKARRWSIPESVSLTAASGRSFRKAPVAPRVRPPFSVLWITAPSASRAITRRGRWSGISSRFPRSWRA